MNTYVLWQRIEGALAFAAGVAIFTQIESGLSWWAALLIFFAPDLSFLAYGLGPRLGAIVYNSVHIYAFGLVVLAIGMFAALPLLAALGALWLAHSGFDRALGYGLKSPTSFSETHLGSIGKNR